MKFATATRNVAGYLEVFTFYRERLKQAAFTVPKANAGSSLRAVGRCRFVVRVRNAGHRLLEEGASVRAGVPSGALPGCLRNSRYFGNY